MPLNGKHFIVTGGAGGIGQHICTMLLARHARVSVIDRVAALPFAAELIHGDLSTLDGIESIAQQLATTRVDGLVNLAGVQYSGLFEQQNPAQVQLHYMVNLVAPVLLAQAVLPQMKQRKAGHIINIGSTFGSIPFAHFVTYSSSKAGLRGFSEALRREVASDGVDVTYVAPRAVKTKLNSEKVMRLAKLIHMNMDEPEWVAEQVVAAIVAKRKDVYLGFPEKLFVRINGVLPRVVDKALFKKDRLAAALFNEAS